MNENVKKVLKENLWYVATCGDEMNVTPVGFKDVAEDGTLEIGAVIMTNTLANLKENDKIAIAACDPKTMECYMQEIPNEEEIDEIQIFKDILQKLGIDDFSPFYEHAYKCGICNEDYSGTIAAEVKKTLINSKVHILKSSSEENFIIGSFPLLYEEIDLGKDSFVKNLFLPIHPKLGVLYTKKDNAFQKQSNKIIEISGSDVLKINSFFIKEEYAEYIISQKKEELQFFLDTQLI